MDVRDLTPQERIMLTMQSVHGVFDDDGELLAVVPTGGTDSGYVTGRSRAQLIAVKLEDDHAAQ